MNDELFRVQLTELEVNAFFDALEFVKDGHYDVAMMMPSASDIEVVEKAFESLRSKGVFPATLELTSYSASDYARLIWWAVREDLADNEEGLDALLRMDQQIRAQSANGK